jgi:hypothetical protein
MVLTVTGRQTTGSTDSKNLSCIRKRRIQNREYRLWNHVIRKYKNYFRRIFEEQIQDMYNVCLYTMWTESEEKAENVRI